MKDKLRIVEYLGGLAAGGAESVIKDYAIELQKRGHQVIIPILYNTPESPIQKEVVDADVKIDVIRGRYRHNIFSRAYNKLLTISGFNRVYIRRLLKNYKPDVIHLHGHTLIDLENLDNELYGVKLVYTCHNPPREFFSGIWRKQYYIAKKLISKHNLQMIALHKEMAEELNNLFCINNTKILHNPIDLGRFVITKSDATEKRKSLGIAESTFVIGNVGRFVEQKNQLFLIDIFNEVKKRKKDSLLLIIGSQESQLLNQIKEKINRFGLEDSSKILIDRADMSELYSVMDCFVMPSLFEGFSIAFIEAQAEGLRCVVSDTFTKEAFFSNDIHVLSLNEPVSVWADTVLGKGDAIYCEKDINSLSKEKIVDQLLKIYNE